MLWQRLVKDFVKGFDSGEFVAGERFPTVRDICNRCNVSNMTARKVVSELAKENYIRLVPRQGSIVCPRPKLKQIFIATNFSATRSRLAVETFDGISKECARWNLDMRYVSYDELKFIHDDGVTGYVITNYRKRNLEYCRRQYGTKYNKMVSYGDAEPCEFIPSCSLDLEKAARIAVEHLIKQGHRRIAITGSKDRRLHTSRIKTYKEVLRENNINYDDSLFKSIAVSSPDYSEKCKKGLKELMSLDRPPTALFCVSGIYALKMVTLCNDLKIRVPDDLAVISIDNYTEMNFVRPRITTVDTHFSKLGEECVKMLIEQAEHPDKKIKDRIIEPHLVIRDSA